MYKVCSTWHGKKRLVDEISLIERRSAYALVIKDSQILLNKMKTTGKYWFPGGVVEISETEKDAAKRETLEETGVEVAVGEEFGKVESYFYYDPSDIAWHQFSSFFLCEIVSTKEDFTNPDKTDESGEVVWVDISEIPEEQMQDYGGEIIRLLKNRF